MIICTCGCRVDDIDDIITCSLQGWSRESTPCVDYVSYCEKCYNKAVADGRVLFNEAEEMAWMRHEDEK